MAREPIVLAVVPIPGLTPDSLGSYLASLGLARVLSRRWPSVRLAWRNACPHVLGGPAALDELLDALSDVAANKNWTPYERGWAESQKQSTKAKSAAPLALWQAEANESQLEMVAAHVVPAAKLFFNPMLGSGGNAGKRDFSDGWKRAVDALAPTSAPKKGQPDAAGKRDELNALLSGAPTTWTIEKLNAASWFSEANKIYNSGQTPFSEGVISPLAMVLACEGLAFFAGGASRRLGSRVRAVGAFPFIVNGAAPQAAGEAGRDLAEVWAPLWDRPMTVREIATLFQRGRAEVGGRGAVTPAAFATAVTHRGVDAGISQFRRFVLSRTTSANTFEPRYEGAVVVSEPWNAPTAGSTLPSQATAVALERLLGLLDKLPRDEKKGDRWRYVGMRGRLEAAIVRIAAAPSGPEAICEVLDAAVAALDRVDRNRAFRELNIQWRPLPTGWIETLFGNDTADVEARLALALVTSFPAALPFALYRFGIESNPGRFVHPKVAPARWVWSGGGVADPLTDVLLRRTLDWEREKVTNHTPADQASTQFPARLMIPAWPSDIEMWLAGGTDDEKLGRWLSRFALFDWQLGAKAPRVPTVPASRRQRHPAGLCLFGLFNPLFDLRPVVWGRSAAEEMREERPWRTPMAARRIATSLRGGDVEWAIDIARGRYAMAGHPLAAMSVPWRTADPLRLLASLLFPIKGSQRGTLVQRWLRPHRNNEGG